MTAPSPAGPAVEARDLLKAYDADGEIITAVRDVNVRIEHGDLAAVMGPSGCGKSTLLHLLGGLTRPSAGQVLLDGADLADLTDNELAEIRRTRIGFVFQAFNLVPVLTAEENVALPATIAGRGRTWAHQRAAELLDTVGLAHRRAQRPNQLSGGEQQRVAIARALVLEPAVVLADEPTGNLDSRTGREIIQLLLRLHHGGQTVVLVTHDVKVAGVADRLFLMRDGHIEERKHAPDAGPDAPRPLDQLIDLDEGLPW